MRFWWPAKGLMYGGELCKISKMLVRHLLFSQRAWQSLPYSKEKCTSLVEGPRPSLLSLCRGPCDQDAASSAWGKTRQNPRRHMPKRRQMPAAKDFQTIPKKEILMPNAKYFWVCEIKQKEKVPIKVFSRKVLLCCVLGTENCSRCR